MGAKREEDDEVAKEVPPLAATDDVREVERRSPPKESESEEKVVSLNKQRKLKESQQYTPPTDTVAAMPDTPSGEEITAKLEAAEARTETRFASLSGNLDLRFAELATR